MSIITRPLELYTAIGVDPGLKDTGIVALSLDLEQQTIHVEHAVVSGFVDSSGKLDVAQTVRTTQVAVSRMMGDGNFLVTIEQYRDRGTVFSTHGNMRELEFQLKRAIPGSRLLENMGVKKIVTKQMMKALHVYDFPTTNHQDLQAAARIGILGALKNDEFNAVFAAAIADHVDGSPWRVV